MTATVQIQIQRTRGPRGYIVNGEQRLGYQDDPALDGASRRKIALWARASGEASPQQIEIIESSNPTPENTAGRVAAREALAPSASPFWELLSPEEQQIVLDPSTAGVSDYPLSMRELTQLTGATDDQVRFWSDNGLIKAHRTGGGQRRFYSEALLRSFFCARLRKQEIAVLMDILNDPSPGMFALFSTLLDQKAVIEPEAELSDAFRASADGLRTASRCLGNQAVRKGAASKYSDKSGKAANRATKQTSAHIKTGAQRSAKSGAYKQSNTHRAKAKAARAAK